MQNLPSWLEQSFKEVRCPHCFFPLQRVGVVALGLRISKRREGKTMAFFEYECMECKKTSMYEMHETSSTKFGLSLLESNNHSLTSPTETHTSIVPPSSDGSRLAIRPSIPRDLPKCPISDREVSRFLNQLKRTSFRRHTKSFRRWVSRLCDRRT